MSFETSFLELYWELNRCYWNLNVLDSGRECCGIERQLHILAKSLRNKKSKHPAVLRALVDYHPEILAMHTYLEESRNFESENGLDIEKLSTDHLLLMALRDRISKKEGFDSYPDLILSSEGFNKEFIIENIHTRLDTQLELSREYTKKYDLSLEYWYTGLRKIKGERVLNHIKLTDQLMRLFQDVYSKLSIQVGGGELGYAVETGKEQVLIHVSRYDTIFDMMIYYHQMGHGIARMIDKTKGLDRIYTSFYEELTGVLVEHLLLKLVPEDIRTCLNEIRTMQYTRFAIEASLEMDLWFSDTSPEDLFRAYCQKIAISIDELPFRMIHAMHISDPFYMYNYVLADIVAENIVKEAPKSPEDLAEFISGHIFEAGQNSNWRKYMNVE